MIQQEQQLKNIRRVTQQYGILKGFAFIPYGVWLLFQSIWTNWLYYRLFPDAHDPAWADLFYFWLPIVLYLLSTYLAVRYYKQAFGQVQLTQAHLNRQGVELIICALAIFGALALDTTFHPILPITGLITVAILSWRWWQLDHLAHYYLVLAALVLILSMLPAFNHAAYDYLYANLHARDSYNYRIYLFAGPLLILIGLCDHLYLLHIFSHARRSMMSVHSLLK